MIELLIIGDSLSSPYGPFKHWPQHIEPETAVVRNLAQAGLTLRDFSLPDYVHPQPGTTRAVAVVYIGTNDVGNGTPLSHFGLKYTETVEVLKLRGYETYCVALPQLAVLDAAVLTQFQTVVGDVADQTGCTYLDPGWGGESTVDGVHPGELNHCYLSAWFTWQLEL